MTPDKWVCLMYHDVVPEAVGISGGPEHFAVSRTAFAGQLDRIQQRGYSGTSLAGAIAGNLLQPVAITFDDGEVGQYQHAFPELTRRGMTATFFITTSWVGKPGFMEWHHIRELADAGMSIQSHTHTHPFLSELPPEEARTELVRSKAILDEALSQDTSTISLPNGDFPTQRSVLAEAGYSVVAMSLWGVNGPRQVRDRRPVYRCTIRGAPERPRFDRILDGDPWTGLPRKVGEWSLNTVRGAMGPSRYHRWRARLLDTLSR